MDSGPVAPIDRSRRMTWRRSSKHDSAVMFPSPCSDLVPVASRGFGQTSVWSGNIAEAFVPTWWPPTGTSSPAAASTSRCAKCATLPRPLASRPASCYLRPPEDDAERAHGSLADRPAQTPRRLSPRGMTLRTFTIIADERRTGSDGLAPVMGSHTPRIPDAGGAIRILGLRLSAQSPPSAARLLLDRAYIASIHADHPAPDYARLRLSYTGTRAVHACRCRKHGPVHDRHTPNGSPRRLWQRLPQVHARLNIGAFADVPALEFRSGRRIGPVHRTLSDHIRASHNPKSLRQSRSGSNERKRAMWFMPADLPLRA